MSEIKWSRRFPGKYFGAGQLRHNYRAEKWADGWVLDQTRNGAWHHMGIYRTLREAKNIAEDMEVAVS